MLEKSIPTPPLDWAAPIQNHRIRRTIEEKRKIVLESLLRIPVIVTPDSGLS